MANSSPNQQTNFALKNQRLNQRILHILATRPYKKAELVTRLITEGINATDKDKIDFELNRLVDKYEEIKSNPNLMLNLKQTVKKHIDPSWQFYTTKEKQLVKDNIDKWKKTQTSSGNLNSSAATNSKLKSSQSLPESPVDKPNNESKVVKQNIPVKEQRTVANETNITSKTNFKPNNSSTNSNQYKQHVREYLSIYPEYQRLYNHIQKVKLKFNKYKDDLLKLTDSAEDISKLQGMKSKIELEASQLGEKFQQDCERQKSLHRRVLFLRDSIQTFTKNKDTKA